MSDKLVRIKNRYDTADNWYNENPILAAGEIGIDGTNNIIKVGNGSDNWNKLLQLNTHAKIFNGKIIKNDPMSLLNELRIKNISHYNDMDKRFVNCNASIIISIYGDGILPCVKTKSFIEFTQSGSDIISFNIIDLLDSNIDNDNCDTLVFVISMYDDMSICVDMERSSIIEYDSNESIPFYAIKNISRNINYDIIAIY